MANGNCPPVAVRTRGGVISEGANDYGMTTASAKIRRERKPNEVWYSLRDTELLTAGITTTVNRFFANPAGKTPLATNLERPGLPRPWTMEVHSLHLRIIPGATAVGTVADNLLTAYISILEDSRVDFRIGEKNHLEFDIAHLGSGTGAHGILASGGTDTVVIGAALSIGPNYSQATFAFPPRSVAHIVWGERFDVGVTWGHAIDTGGLPGGAGTLRCYLRGVLDRGINT
jgi:hypothetical protein